MKKVILILFLFVAVITAQEKFEKCCSENSWKYFPGNLNFQPLTANFLEPKLGFLFTIADNDLRLDIGNSMDVFHYNSNGIIYSFGADLFTYTMLRGESDFHFPVDAVDYLFGFNFTYKKQLCNAEIGGRLRISHISAHFVDGHYDNPTGKWLEGRGPIVYSREFVEYIQTYRINGFRGYAGFTWLFHVDPSDINTDIYQAGFDYFAEGLISKYITPYIAYDLRIQDFKPGYYNHSVSAGVKFGYATGRGFSLYYNYYSGKSIHGEYYDVGREYSAIGMNFEL